MIDMMHAPDYANMDMGQMCHTVDVSKKKDKQIATVIR